MCLQDKAASHRKADLDSGIGWWINQLVETIDQQVNIKINRHSVWMHGVLISAICIRSVWI
jgi:hypothetical protein